MKSKTCFVIFKRLSIVRNCLQPKSGPINFEKVKTEMEILTTGTEHFFVKLGNMDNDFNEWLVEKELSKEFQNNILSEWLRKVEYVNKQLGEV